MVTKEQIEQLIHFPPTGNPILSLYLDMSVNSDNKRTHHVFLNQQKANFTELSSDRENHHRVAVGEALDRMERWLDSDFQPQNRGVVAYVELGGDWFHAIQLGQPVRNRLSITDRPIVGPLAEVFTKSRCYGIALLDREHMRVFSCDAGELNLEKEVRPEAYPTPHDVTKGGYAAKDYQKYKMEEASRFFRMFSEEVEQVERRQQCDHWVLIGTDENVAQFRAFLPRELEQKVIYSCHGSVDATETEILQRLDPFFNEQLLHDEAAKVNLLRDRVRNRHFAIGGIGETLERLQEGKVATLVIARDLERDGAQCMNCGFYLDRSDGDCPYCGGQLRPGVDLAESMIRMAADQECELEFVDPAPIRDLEGVGALLKF